MVANTGTAKMSKLTIRFCVSVLIARSGLTSNGHLVVQSILFQVFDHISDFLFCPQKFNSGVS